MDMCITRIAAILLVLGGLAAGQSDPVKKAKEAVAASKFAEALSVLEENYAQLKGNLEALLLLARCSLETGQNDKAMDYALAATGKDEENVTANRLAGLAFFRRALEAANDARSTGGQVQGLFEEASQFFETALKNAPKDAELWALKAECQYRSGDKEAAVQAASDYGRALALDPKRIDWHVGAIKALRFAGKRQEALAACKRGLAAVPGSSSLLMQQGDLHGQAQPPRLDEALASYREALKSKDLSIQDSGTIAGHVWGILGNSKRYEEALAVTRDWIGAHKNEYTAWWWAGQYEYQLERYDDAIKDFEKAWKVSKQRHGNSALWIADCHWAKGDLETAARWVLKASKAQWFDNRRTPASQINKFVSTYFQKNDLEKAVAYLEKYGLVVGPDDWRLLNNLGFAYRDLATSPRNRGKVKEYSKKSAAYYERAVKSVLADENATATQKAQTLNDCAILYHFARHKINKVGHAVDYYRQALEFDPGYIDALENLGLCMNELGRYEDAISLFKKVLKKQPQRMMSIRGLRQARAGKAGG